MKLPYNWIKCETSFTSKDLRLVSNKTDIQAIKAYNKALSEGIDIQSAYEECLNNTSDAAQYFATESAGSAVSLDDLSEF